MLKEYAGLKRPDEDWKQYVARAEQKFVKFKHPGNHVYCWAVGDEKKRTRRKFHEPLPFPKIVELANLGVPPNAFISFQRSLAFSRSSATFLFFWRYL